MPLSRNIGPFFLNDHFFRLISRGLDISRNLVVDSPTGNGALNDHGGPIRSSIDTFNFDPDGIQLWTLPGGGGIETNFSRFMPVVYIGEA